MLKLGKGLKKKKKNKKGKKDQELFTEEELEKYKQEHAHKVETEEAGTSEEGAAKPSSNEEFEKFKLLTAGVDDILRKSQGDLDRIKKESFFQRKPTPSELKAAEEAERLEREKSEGNWEGFEQNQINEVTNQPEEFHPDEESESEYEDNDDIFDTAYVDDIESGKIKLAHIPDDDELGLNDGPDPFDTSGADELLRRAEEEERKKKKEISLGLAVNVLSGRAERDKSLLEDGVETKVVKQVRARPRKIQDFCLLGSFDETSKAANPLEETSAEVGEVALPLSLLDEEVEVEGELPEGDVLLSEVLVKQIVKPATSGFATPEENPDEVENFKELVCEFEIGPSAAELELKKLEEEEEFDEFSALAVSSVINQKLEQELEQFEAVEDDPFDTTEAEQVLRAEPDPFNSIEGEAKHLPVHIPQASTPWSAFDEEAKEVDPFDTGFADDCAPGKVELRLIEKEILETSIPQTVAKKFDVHLEARILSRNNSEDFNPRAGEDRAKNQRVSIHITDPSGDTQRGSESEEIVALSLSHRDLLGGSTSDLSNLGDQPLPPSTESPCDELSRYCDPFDTSLADQAVAPGRAELKFIENELLSDIREIVEPIEEDDDFDPRAGDKKGVSFDIPSPIAPDLLASVKEEGTRPLTPYYTEAATAESDIDLEVEDPFDTSHVTSLPGKQELKLIEQELEQTPAQPAVFQPIHETLGINPENVEGGLKHSLSDQDFNPRSEDTNLEVVQPAALRRFSDISGLNRPPHTLPLRSSLSEDKPDLLAVVEEIGEKALTPAVEEEDLSSYVDPFDTTIAENIAPGKAELKVLEVELVGSLTRSYTDEDFNPRDAPAPSIPEGKLKAVPSTQPLQPTEVVEEEIDPFDTSFASNLAPGKTELRLLESELVG